MGEMGKWSLEHFTGTAGFTGLPEEASISASFGLLKNSNLFGCKGTCFRKLEGNRSFGSLTVWGIFPRMGLLKVSVWVNHFPAFGLPWDWKSWLSAYREGIGSLTLSELVRSGKPRLLVPWVRDHCRIQGFFRLDPAVEKRSQGKADVSLFCSVGKWRDFRTGSTWRHFTLEQVKDSWRLRVKTLDSKKGNF